MFEVVQLIHITYQHQYYTITKLTTTNVADCRQYFDTIRWAAEIGCSL